MQNYITSININSFRGIKEFELNNLAQINILTGDNNCGKTSVLEVLESFKQPDDFFVWLSLIRRDVATYREGLSYYEGIYNLFDINAEEKKLEYSIQTRENITNILLLAKEEKELLTEEEYYILQGITYRLISNEDEKLTSNTQLVSKLKVEIKMNGETVAKDNVYQGQRNFLKVADGDEKYKKNIVYISPTRHTEGNLFLSQVLDNPELYEEMLNILKEYDENIVSINYDNQDNMGFGKGVYKILSKSHKKALPLNVYGDGMKKAILLMSAVVKAKNGILLLDEFETAIHTSAMNKTFKWIFETCKKLNVQVFLTSHSKEAIDKVLKCSKEIIDDIAVYTMYKDNEGISVRRLNGTKAIEVQDEMGLELR